MLLEGLENPEMRKSAREASPKGESNARPAGRGN
jgi:hypothetical protein